MQNNIINVVDAVCGEGKSTALINYINSKENSNKKFLYITPFLTEVERIKNNCPNKNFKSPESKGAKIYDIRNLLSKGENIVSSHSLFSRFNEETIDLLSLNDYTLIMDEVADVVQVVDISKYDLDTLLEKYVEVKEGGRLEWVASEYEGKFDYFKKQCELNSLYVYSVSNKVKPILIWMFPTSIFKSFKEVFVLTYLFDCQIQKYYYDYYGFKYSKWYIKDYNLTKEFQKYDLSRFKNLINIYENDKLNKIGDSPNSLSMGWYERNKDNISIKILRNNCSNYFKNIVKTSSDLNMWTTFKEYKNIIKGKGYTKGFVSLSMRATNLYIKRESVAYLANRFLNPVIKNFFISYGVSIDEDRYALSELLQFLFRSRIRKGEPINLYIPSSRMRNILKEWIKEISENSSEPLDKLEKM